ncbi:MAG: MBL fold metallo-hydrolase, partial [Anaerolineales bacterium]
NPAASISPEAVEADFILISHGHGDHVGDSIAIARRTDAMVISNDEIANWFANQGVKKTHGQHLGGGYKHPFGYLKLTFAIHGSALPDGSNGGNPCGFLLTTNDGKKIYMAQDTGLFGDMKLIGEEGLDLAVVPIGTITPWDPTMPCARSSFWSRRLSFPSITTPLICLRRMQTPGLHASRTRRIQKLSY